MAGSAPSSSPRDLETAGRIPLKRRCLSLCLLKPLHDLTYCVAKEAKGGDKHIHQDGLVPVLHLCQVEPEAPSFCVSRLLPGMLRCRPSPLGLRRLSAA